MIEQGNRKSSSFFAVSENTGYYSDYVQTSGVMYIRLHVFITLNPYNFEIPSYKPWRPKGFSI